MKITLSKKKRGERRHIVLVCDRSEASAIHMIIYQDVLNREVVPKREMMRNGMVRYRFAMKWLESLMLTFPYANFSPGLESQLSAAAFEELQEMQVPDLDIPGFTGELYDFQKVGVGKMTSKTRYILNDQMGLGKSVQLLAALLHRQSFPALVVVPNGIKFNWERMIERFTDCTSVVMDGSKPERRQQLRKEADITIVNTEALRVRRRAADNVCQDRHCPLGESLHIHDWYEFKNPGLFFENDSQEHIKDIDLPNMEWREWVAIGIDEYHHFKNPTSQQTTGLHMIHGHRQYAMSGTPLLNGRPEELWSILHWMWPIRYPSYSEFERKHCVKKKSVVVAYTGLIELKEHFHSRSLRRRKEHVHDQLPEVIYVDDVIELTREQRRLYDEILEHLRLWVEEEPRRVPTILAQITRLKQAAFSPELYGGSPHSAKIDRVKELMAELTASGQKAIIFSQWSRAARILERELAQYNPAYIDGTVKVKDRMVEIDKFNNDEDCQVFIGTIGACREGFTLDAGTYVIFTDKGWTPAENMQAAARSAAGGLRGVGVETPVHIIEIRANETIEEDIEKLLARKQAMNDRMVERDAGAAVERITLSDLREMLGLGRENN